MIVLLSFLVVVSIVYHSKAIHSVFHFLIPLLDFLCCILDTIDFNIKDIFLDFLKEENCWKGVFDFVDSYDRILIVL